MQPEGSRASPGAYAPVVTVRQAAVAAGSPGAAEAAAGVLRTGGNAVDAAIAAAMAATVCEPGLASLGGGGFLAVRTPDGDEVVHDFFVDAPGRGHDQARAAPELDTIVINFGGANQVFHAGLGSLAVPGVLDGLVHAHARHGRLDLAQVSQPAQRLALHGWVVDPIQASVLVLLAEILRLTEECWTLYSRWDQPAAPGSRLTNPALATTLEAIGSGGIRRFADLQGVPELLGRVQAAGGDLTSADLDAYRPVEREPLRAEHLGAVLATNPAPSFGGPILAEATRLLGEQGPVGFDPAGVARLITALRGATDTEKRMRLAGQAAAVRGTTHVSVVDADGGIASLTQSNGSCSGIVVPGTGVQVNNVMGEEDLHPGGLHTTPPGTRIGSMMAPSILDMPDGRVVALGSGGSERIRSAMLGVLVGLVDRGEHAAGAVESPRVHWDGSGVQAEPPLAPDVATVLESLGPVTVWDNRHLYFGGAHVAVRHPDGHVEAHGDSRRGGVARIVEVR